MVYLGNGLVGLFLVGSVKVVGGGLYFSYFKNFGGANWRFFFLAPIFLPEKTP